MDVSPEDLHKRVLKFCTKKSWRLSAQDTGTEDPVFEELRTFVVEEDQTGQKETVYHTERKIRQGGTSPASSDSLPSAQSTGVNLEASPPDTICLTGPAPVTRPAPATDPVAELSEQFSKLDLLIQENMSPSPRLNIKRLFIRS